MSVIVRPRGYVAMRASARQAAPGVRRASGAEDAML
jgi:hypothetical protein